MIFNSLEINNGIEVYRYNFSKRTFITSGDNKHGKTSLVRFLLYSLGFHIPMTTGLSGFQNKAGFYTFLTLEFNKQKIKIKRTKKRIYLYKNNVEFNFIETENNILYTRENLNTISSIVYP